MDDDAPSPSILLRLMAAALVGDEATIERHLDGMPQEELQQLLEAAETLERLVRPRLSQSGV